METMNKSLAKHEAFLRIIKSGKAKSINFQIYQALLTEPRTIEYFRNILVIPHQSCTGCLSTLEDIGWVYKAQTVRTGKKSFTLYRAETDIMKAKQRMYNMEKYKKQEWLKRGIKNAWFDEQTLNSLKIIQSQQKLF